MAIRWKNNKGILLVLLGAVCAATAMCAAYPSFRERVRQEMEAQQEELTSEEAQEEELFAADEDFCRYLLSSIYYIDYEMTPDTDAYQYFTSHYDTDSLTADEEIGLQEAAGRLMKNMRNQYTSVQQLNNYGSYGLGSDRDYGYGDTFLQSCISGASGEVQAYYRAGIVIAYDSRGVPTVRSFWGMDVDEAALTEYLSGASLSRLMEDNGLYEDEDGGEFEEETMVTVESADEEASVNIAGTYAEQDSDRLLAELPLPNVQNAVFVFAVHKDNTSDIDTWDLYLTEQNAYMQSGYQLAALCIFAAMILLALVLQNLPAAALRDKRVFLPPTELLLVCVGIGLTFGEFLISFGQYTMNGSLVDDLERVGFGGSAAQAAVVLIWLFWFAFALAWYWAAAAALPYVRHPIRTLRERALSIRLGLWLKKQWLRFWHWATDIELDEKLTKHIWRAVALNGLIVAALCCIWIGGVIGVVIYSVLLYFLLRRRCGEVQRDYGKLLEVTRAIAEGNLNAPTDGDMGLFNPLRDELALIRSGFSRAVEDEVKSRNLKTELITNVSHDLKTPLTAIITYVDLLKKDDLTEEERKSYIDILDRKSRRLKALIEDLFEVSKAATGNIEMHLEDVELVSLLKQARLENEDRIRESTLDFRFRLPQEKCVLSLDPQRTFRVIDNLLQNILKYAMPHSRAYIELTETDGEVVLTFKNMSAEEMNFTPEEITERFVRGDLSRNTEGSGLGLAIAQSFTERQGGTFLVETDGDLFKVTLTWRK